MGCADVREGRLSKGLSLLLDSLVATYVVVSRSWDEIVVRKSGVAFLTLCKREKGFRKTS